VTIRAGQSPLWSGSFPVRRLSCDQTALTGAYSQQCNAARHARDHELLHHDIRNSGERNIVEKLRFEQSSSRIDRQVDAVEVSGGCSAGSTCLIGMIGIRLNELELCAASRDMPSGRHSALEIPADERNSSRPGFRERNGSRQRIPGVPLVASTRRATNTCLSCRATAFQMPVSYACIVVYDMVAYQLLPILTSRKLRRSGRAAHRR
jgi:hypothetical protein